MRRHFSSAKTLKICDKIIIILFQISYFYIIFSYLIGFIILLVPVDFLNTFCQKYLKSLLFGTLSTMYGGSINTNQEGNFRSFNINVHFYSDNIYFRVHQNQLIYCK